MSDGASSSSLLVRVGGRLCALPLRHVVETMRARPVDDFAGAPPYVRGVAMIRGVPTPVVEAARLLGRGDAPGARWIAMTAGDRPVALAVDDVLGVRELAATDRAPLPSLLQDAAPGLVVELGRLDAELLLVLEGAYALSEDVWAALDRAGAAVP